MVLFNLKLNSIILLCKTLNSVKNVIEMRADRNKIQTVLKIFFLASKIIFPGSKKVKRGCFLVKMRQAKRRRGAADPR